jgi:large subunit ribosomal protein L21
LIAFLKTKSRLDRQIFGRTTDKLGNFRKINESFPSNILHLQSKNWKNMFTIVKIAGQQFKVTEGQNLYVPHISGKQGDKVEFSDIILHNNEGKISLGKDANVKVKAEIVNDLVKGDKVIAFKMKRRKGFRKKHGHRTQYTHIKVTGIA